MPDIWKNEKSDTFAGMSNKAKMFKIRTVATFPNVFQNQDYRDPVMTDHSGAVRTLKGRWREEVFGNANPLVLELACGKGDYALGLARLHPEKNYIGVDVKGARIYTGAKTALEENLSQVAFARMRIENILHFFGQGEVDEIWITFPDPFPRKGDVRRRLSSPAFLSLYRQMLRPGGLIHFKTDDLPLFHYTRDMVWENGCTLLQYAEDIYQNRIDMPEAYIQTFYEKGHIANGKTINYLNFTLLP